MKYTSTALSFWEVKTKYTKSILKVYSIPARVHTGKTTLENLTGDINATNIK